MCARIQISFNLLHFPCHLRFMFFLKLSIRIFTFTSKHHLSNILPLLFYIENMRFEVRLSHFHCCFCFCEFFSTNVCQIIWSSLLKIGRAGLSFWPFKIFKIRPFLNSQEKTGMSWQMAIKQFLASLEFWRNFKKHFLASFW